MSEKCCCRNCYHKDYTDDSWDLSKERPYCELGCDDGEWDNNGICDRWEGNR